MTIEDLSKDQKFQAFAMRRTIDHKVVHPKKMLHDFTVRLLVESLAKFSNERRADLVQKCTGIKRGSALKLSTEDSIKAIELALAERDTTAEDVFDDKSEPKGISEDEIIRLLPPDRVFNTWFYSGFITAEGEEDKALMADLWDFILEHKLLGEMTALQLAQDLGLHHFVSDKCPLEKRAELMLRVLQFGEPLMSSSKPDGSSSSANAKEARPFSAVALFSVVKPKDLVKFVRLSEMSKPIEALARVKNLIKAEPGLPPGVADSVIPPPDAADDAEADAAAVEALAATDGSEGVEVVLDADGDSADEPAAESGSGEKSSRKRGRDKR